MRGWHSITTGLALATALAISACGSETGPGQPVNGSMTAKIDGGNWSASVAVAATYTGNILAIAGTDGNGRTIGFATVASAPGTTSIATTVGANASLTIGANAWSAGSTIGSGTMVITALTTTGARGTFQFVLSPVASSGATGTRNITEGTFDVTF